MLITAHRARVFLLALVPLATIMLVGCRSDRSSDGERSGPKLTVDERNGTVEGVGLGDNPRRIERVFGDSPPWKQAADFYPLSIESEDVTFPAGRRDPPGRANALRYRGVSFFVIADEALDVYVTSERARTRRGLRPLRGDRRRVPAEADRIDAAEDERHGHALTSTASYVCSTRPR